MTGQHLSYAAGMPATAQTFASEPLGKSKHSSARLSHPWDAHGAAKIKMVKLYRLPAAKGLPKPQHAQQQRLQAESKQKSKAEVSVGTKEKSIVYSQPRLDRTCPFALP